MSLRSTVCTALALGTCALLVTALAIAYVLRDVDDTDLV